MAGEGPSPSGRRSGPEDGARRIPLVRRETWRRFRRSRRAVWALAAVVIYISVGVSAAVSEWVLRREGAQPPYAFQVGRSLEYRPPSLEHLPMRLLGTDNQGRSVLYTVLHAVRVALVVGFTASLVASAIGVVLGILSGFFGRRVDDAVVFLYSTVDSIPSILLMLSFGFLFRKNEAFARIYQESPASEVLSLGLFTLVLAIGFSSWVPLCRLLRAEVLKQREQEYVVAARALGMGSLRILFRHVLPNVFHLVIIHFSLLFVIAVKSEVILSFLGLGAMDEPSWGRMIADARIELFSRGVWWPVASAGACMFILMLAVNVLGDALRDALDPRLRE